MTAKEALETIKAAKAEVEWNYPLDYAAAFEAVLELVERQQSEIEELTTEVENLKKQMEWLTGYNQNLMSANTALSEEILIAKIEAYKQFAGKAAIALANAYSPEYAHWIDNVLDNLLKELIGELK